MQEKLENNFFPPQFRVYQNSKGNLIFVIAQKRKERKLLVEHLCPLYSYLSNKRVVLNKQVELAEFFSFITWITMGTVDFIFIYYMKNSR